MSGSTDARQHYYLQFVSAPTADTTGTVTVLHFDNKRYMFGRMAEGTQRACTQRGVGVKKVRNLFLTGTNTWRDNGGLIGIILTLADQQVQEVEDNRSLGRPRLNIHGGPKLLHTVACARRFVFRTGVPLTVHESTGNAFTWPSEPSFVDENIQVWPIAIPAGTSSSADHEESQRSNVLVQSEQAARQKIVSDMFNSEWHRDRLIETPFNQVQMPATVWLRNSETKELESFYCSNMDDAPEIAPKQNVLVRDPWPASLVGRLPDASNLPSGVAMSYIMHGHHQRGSFDNAKAKKLGVPQGAIRKELVKGNPITLNDGRIITPDMVIAPGKEGRGVAFFDLPTAAHLGYLRGLILDSPGMLDNIALAVWTLGKGVGASEEFRAVVQSLDKLDHLSSDPDTAANLLAFESVAESSIRLSEVSSSLFPVPKYDNVSPYETPTTVEKSNNINKSDDCASDASTGSVAPVQAGLKILMEPTYARDSKEIPVPTTVESAPKAVSQEYLEALDALKKGAKLSRSYLNEPEIVTLGTGSALPSKYRNVSATLLRMPGKQGNYLFDCGENTMGQLRRVYNSSELRDILMNLKAIWISHLHADHHLGTISVLQERATVFDQYDPDGERAIYVMSEQNMLDFLREYSSVEPSLINNTGMLPLVCSPDIGPTLDGEVFDFAAHRSPIKKVETVHVSHCRGAQAISITFKSGFKISYSGDCRPSRSFCRIGDHSDVLIHEATFDVGMDGDAKAKKHSTTSEALGVAFRMKARNVILTHFSQRYQKVPNLDNVKIPTEIKDEEGDAEVDAGPMDSGGADVKALPVEPLDRQSAMSLSNFLDAEPPSEPPTDRVSSTDAALLSSLSTSRTATRRRRQSAAARGMAVCVAFDYMRVRVSQIKECNKLYPAIEAMFDEMEQRSEAKKAAIRESVELASSERKKGKKGKQNVETVNSSGIESVHKSEQTPKQGEHTQEGETAATKSPHRVDAKAISADASENNIYPAHASVDMQVDGETPVPTTQPEQTASSNGMEDISSSITSAPAPSEEGTSAKSKNQLKREAKKERRQSLKKAKLAGAVEETSTEEQAPNQHHHHQQEGGQEQAAALSTSTGDDIMPDSPPPLQRQEQQQAGS